MMDPSYLTQHSGALTSASKPAPIKISSPQREACDLLLDKVGNLKVLELHNSWSQPPWFGKASLDGAQLEGKVLPMGPHMASFLNNTKQKDASMSALAT